MKDLLILERGEWTADQLVVHQIIEDRKIIQLYPGDEEAIQKNWERILQKNPKAFPGPTIRLIGQHHLGDRLVLEVIPSDYKEGCFVSWLGVAMVPITSDGYVVLQGPVASVAVTIGDGIRVPGCTPINSEIICHIIEEMKEEFGINVARKNLTILGVVEVRPPIAKLHHDIIVKVKLEQNRKELRKCWEKAKDKWEGDLRFLKLDPKLITPVVNNPEYNEVSRLIVKIVAESESVSL